jgi:PAS domain S-box-containing protein
MNAARTVHKRKILVKYFAYSFLVGLGILILIWILLISNSEYSLSLDGLGKLHSADNYVYFIDLMPLILGLYSLTLGSKFYQKISNLSLTVKTQTETIQKTAAFAEEIGKGEFNSEFEPNGEKDLLGKALLEMRKSLLEANKNEVERNWIISGVAEVSEILRRNTELVQLSEEVVAYLTKKINAIQGAFYIVNDDDEDNVFIEMVGSYAYNKKKYLSAKFKFGQGLVGQAAIEQDIVFRTEIPDEYVTVTSGLLGDRKPSCILIVPLITNEVVYGAVELAGFEKFTPLQVKFIQELSDIVARTIFNVKVNEKTVRLLNESQKMSAELSEQSEQLMENARQMQENQEMIERTNRELEVQIQEVNKSQQRTQVLLENASEIINIYDEDGAVKYASPSIKNILGYNPDDLVGSMETDRVHPKGKETVRKLFEDLRYNPGNVYTAQYTYLKPDGTRTWVETTGRNLVDNPSINGILFNIRDITERKKAEKEQRERAKMQALSENSLDIILRFDLMGDISYINPAIEKYTGKSSDQFRAQNIENIPLDDTIVSRWKEIIEELKDKNSHVSTEMEFIDLNGEKLFMEVNALPESGEDGLLESILMILHDITEAKLAEHKIKEANQKVQDSINYAKRIQNSILPKEIVLKDVFKESFMLFRPKDVVSGDFPFIVQKGEYVYFAAVDCTGHGVPGALLSVIGSLILNEIIHHDTPTPSVMLDQLHASVVRTLRQGQEGGENERDGMDVGMLRVHLPSGEMHFAGAHRPLYIVRHNQKPDEELEELKGDKYPIGGVQYRGRDVFTNFETKLEKGDRVYVCSDGYPDQFGGPDPNDLKKIGPKKIRKILVENKDKNISGVHDALVAAFDEWQGPHKQMDDVLFIGIEY